MSLRRNRLKGLRVELPALITTDASNRGPRPEASAWVQPALNATCVDLNRTNARFTAQGSPRIGSEVCLDITLPNHRHARLAGFVVSSLVTTAPALLCGERDRSLGATFDVEFERGNPDLTFVFDLIEARMLETRKTVVRKLRRTHVGGWLRA